MKITNSVKLLFVFTSLILSGIISYGDNYNILNLGASPDGITLNTVIIQNAIDQCNETGGGEIIFPPGKYLTGTIELKSGVFLNIQKGATLLGCTKLEDYLKKKPDFIALRTSSQSMQLIYAEGQSDIGITGHGTIDGQGKIFIRDGNDAGIKRPHIMQLINCRNIKIEGIFMKNSGAWMQHYLACENLQIKGIRVYNHCNYNNDGIDIDGCRDVVISDCIIDSDDDGICLKSTSPSPCVNVIVSDCIVHSHCNSLKLGTESTGGFQNIQISNCLVSPSTKKTVFSGSPEGRSAISVEMVDGGILNQISIDNITVLETRCPIFVRLGNRARKYYSEAPKPPIGILKNVSITNVVATTSSTVTSSITGIPGHYAHAIYLGNIQITNNCEGTLKEEEIIVPEKIEAYPKASMFGEVLPASGFYVRHVKNIIFDNVRISLNGENTLPAFKFEDAHDVSIRNPEFLSPHKAQLVSKNNCSNIHLISR